MACSHFCPFLPCCFSENVIIDIQEEHSNADMMTKSPASSTRLLPVVILASCIGVLLLAWKYGTPDASRGPDRQMPPCQLSASVCRQAGAHIWLGTDTIRPMQPTTITVNWPALASEQPLELRLEGKEMAMGIYKLLLEKQPSGDYQAELLLPVCTQRSMTWIGTITAGHPESRPPLYISLRMTSK